MTKFEIFSLAPIAALVMASAAIAGDKDAPKPTDPAPSTPVRVISLEDFKARCLDPSKTDVQKAPESIRVVCTNKQVVWRAGDPGEIPLKSMRSVSASILADKFAVAAETADVPLTQRNGACQRFVEAVETYTMEKPMSCGEILNMKSSLSEVCLTALDSDEGKDRWDGKDKDKMVKTELTGKVLDTCGNLASPPKGDNK